MARAPPPPAQRLHAPAPRPPPPPLAAPRAGLPPAPSPPSTRPTLCAAPPLLSHYPNNIAPFPGFPTFMPQQASPSTQDLTPSQGSLQMLVPPPQPPAPTHEASEAGIDMIIDGNRLWTRGNGSG